MAAARWERRQTMAESQEKELEEVIAERLREAGLKFATERAIGGLAPDFIVYAPDGRQFVVETRNWDFPGVTTEASRQAQHYQDTANFSSNRRSR